MSHFGKGKKLTTQLAKAISTGLALTVPTGVSAGAGGKGTNSPNGDENLEYATPSKIATNRPTSKYISRCIISPKLIPFNVQTIRQSDNRKVLCPGCQVNRLGTFGVELDLQPQVVY